MLPYSFCQLVVEHGVRATRRDATFTVYISKWIFIPITDLAEKYVRILSLFAAHKI